jgi:hypothetical protein
MLALGRGVLAERTGLKLADEVPFETWRDVGARLGRISDASAWWIADWVFQGQWRYGKRYEEALALTGLDYQTLANYKYVAGRFDVSRRRENLSFAHHLEVASLPLDEQDACLDRAEKEGWSRNALREHVRTARAGVPTEASARMTSPPAPAGALEINSKSTDRGYELLQVRVVEELVDELVGRWIECSSFRLDAYDDGTYELRVRSER